MLYVILLSMKHYTPYRLLAVHLLAFSLAFPVSAFAVDFEKLWNQLAFIRILNIINDWLITPLIVILIFSALILFFYGLASFLSSEDSKKKEQAKGQLIWSTVGIFVLFSIWGIVWGLTQITVGNRGFNDTQLIEICGGDSGKTCSYGFWRREEGRLNPGLDSDQ